VKRETLFIQLQRNALFDLDTPSYVFLPRTLRACVRVCVKDLWAGVLKDPGEEERKGDMGLGDVAEIFYPDIYIMIYIRFSSHSINSQHK